VRDKYNKYKEGDNIMAKRIEGTNEYLPGVIYQLQVCVDGNWEPFYVGETTNPGRRLREHQLSAAAATEHSTFVYRSIRYGFEPAGCEWRMQPVHESGAEGPEDAEDEHIMMLLRQGTTLTNEKKGNAVWMQTRVREAQDMVHRKITSYRKYREVIDQEAANARHAGWIDNDKRALPDDFYDQIGSNAEQRRQREQDRLERQARRDAEIAAIRIKQEAEWAEQVKRMMASYGKTDDAV
jgi:hypothetical protein